MRPRIGPLSPFKAPGMVTRTQGLLAFELVQGLGLLAVVAGCLALCSARWSRGRTST
jgi:hypothetical protein